MGDVIKPFSVRSSSCDRARKLKLYFDSGSPYTFIKSSSTRGFKAVWSLPKPLDFGGMGDGVFEAQRMMHLEVCMLRIWVRHSAYVVADSVLDDDEDLLVGHDFMQKFDVKIDSRRRDVILNRGALRRSQKVRAGG